MLSQKTRPFLVDGPYSVSARDGAPGSEFCVRHRARSIDELRKIGAIPRFIDTGAVERAIDKVTKPGFAAGDAQRRLDDELQQLRSGGLLARRSEAFNQARLEQLTVDVQVDGVIDALDHRIARPVRRKIAVKSLDLARAGSYAVTSFELDRDMDVRAALTFDADIGMCRALDIRVGAVIESRASHFVLHARSLRGTWRSAATTGDPGIDGEEGTQGGDGAAGRDAVCVGIFSNDLTPTNGFAGGNAGNGTDGLAGSAGSDGGDLEQHLEVLVSGMVVDTSGSGGGKGGHGGKGGPGGKGGNGNGCEPSGLGGRGGDGGPGGNGGNGGKGGDAGSLYIYYVSDQSAGVPPVLTAAGGETGRGGLAGLGGEAGAAGVPGPASKYGKKRWDPPAAGGPGAVGATGVTGAPGAPGRNKTPVLEAVPLV